MLFGALRRLQRADLPESGILMCYFGSVACYVDAYCQIHSGYRKFQNNDLLVFQARIVKSAWFFCYCLNKGMLTKMKLLRAFVARPGVCGMKGHAALISTVVLGLSCSMPIIMEVFQMVAGQGSSIGS